MIEHNKDRRKLVLDICEHNKWFIHEFVAGERSPIFKNYNSNHNVDIHDVVDDSHYIMDGSGHVIHIGTPQSIERFVLNHESDYAMSQQETP